MKNRQKGLVIWLLLICLLAMAGCSKEPGLIEEEYDLKSNIVYYAPLRDGKGIDDYGFEATFYKFCLGDPVYADRMGGHVTYYAGEDAVLTGKNVDALNGMAVQIMYYDYKNAWKDEEEYRKMREEHFKEMFKGKYPNQAEFDQAVKEATDLAMEYFPKAQCMGVNLMFNGSLAEDVKVEKIEIPSIDFSIETDSFEVKTFELPENVIPCFNEVTKDAPVTLNTYGLGGTPYLTEGYNTPVIFCEESEVARGVANKEILSMEAESLTEFLHIKGKNGNTHFKKGKEFLLKFDYGFDEESIKDVASVCGSAVLKVRTMDGKEYWYFDTMKIGVNEFHLMPTFINMKMQ